MLCIYKFVTTNTFNCHNTIALMYFFYREAENEIRRLTELAEQLNPKLHNASLAAAAGNGDNLSTSDQVN